jgi:putative phosphoribosyl transferase
VASEIARALNAPLDVLAVGAVEAPGHSDLEIGAIATDNAQVVDDELVQALGMAPSAVLHLTRKALEEAEAKQRLYRAGLPPLNVTGNTVIVVDEGLVTGLRMSAAVLALKSLRPARVILAVPVAGTALQKIQGLVDRIVCLFAPDDFSAGSRWYNDFPETTDDEVCALLSSRRRKPVAVGK